MKIINRITLIIVVFAATLNIRLSAGDGLLFKPLIGNIYESRLGGVVTNNQDKLRLDIGGNYDFYQNTTKPSFLWAIGGEFFTYTRLRSEGNFKFPVETTDFYFGINASSKFSIIDLPIESRLRIAHISTHLSDGYSSNSIFFQEPFVYSREFLDLTFASKFGDFRPYLGSIIVFSYIPKDVNLIIPQLGCEYRNHLFSQFDFALAYDLKINGYQDQNLQKRIYKAMNMIVGGIMIRTNENRSVFLKFERYFGANYYGQFYQQCDNYYGVGFELMYY